MLRRIEDVTSDWAVINVQGPSSLALLRRLVPEVADLQFSHSVEARLGEAGVRLLRLSYVGERGYEVHVPRAEAAHVLDTLLATAEAAGQEVTLAGMEAMESLALEAGYRHWPSDISQVGRSLCVWRPAVTRSSRLTRRWRPGWAGCAARPSSSEASGGCRSGGGRPGTGASSASASSPAPSSSARSQSSAMAASWDMCGARKQVE